MVFDFKDNSGYSGKLIRAVFLFRVGALVLIVGAVMELLGHHPDVEPIFTLPIFFLGVALILTGFVIMGGKFKHLKPGRVKHPERRKRRLTHIVWGLVGLGLTLSFIGLDFWSDVVLLLFHILFAYMVWKMSQSDGGGGGGDDDPSDGPGGGIKNKEKKKY